MTFEFAISGMKCQSCVGKIRAALERAGFRHVEVTLDPPRGKVQSDNPLAVAEIERAVASVGEYRAHVTGSTPASENQLEAGVEGQSEDLTPLVIVLGYLLLSTMLYAWQTGHYRLHHLMPFFMGGFFILFSLFKMINLTGFADAFSTYDVLAKRSRGYALAYPFIELGLGIAYILHLNPIVVNSVTMVFMLVGSIGVYQALRTNKRFQCACLGTALKLPMTKVTLLEDVGMGLMALAMLMA